MINLNDVKETLITLGCYQGFDLTDPKVSEKMDHKTVRMEWAKDYTSGWNWEDQFQEDLRKFLNHMEVCQTAIDGNNFQIARGELLMAMIYAGNLTNSFDSIKSDISSLLYAEHKTNDFIWPPFEDE